MQYAMEPVVASGYLSDGEATLESINLAPIEGHQWNQLQDGTIEVTDRLPKKDYYLSLRRFNTTISNAGTTQRMGSISSGSALGPVNGTSAAAGGGTFTACGPNKPSGTNALSTGSTFRGRTNASLLDFKPSGKTVDCTVVMLDGTAREFRIDRAAYGQQLFESVCAHLGLLEVEYFGITFYDTANNLFWLNLHQKIAKQLGKNDWQFEFQVKFYPYDIDSIREDLTRYYLCLQVRQDIVSGHGKSPQEADRLFLQNARVLALYGVDLHRVKNSQDKDVSLGVYYGGILVYRNRLRLMRISWPRIISLSHRGRHFVVVLRPSDTENMDRNMSFKCINTTAARRLYTVTVEHHAFFRLRGSARPKKPSFLPSFATRKYHYPSSILHSPTMYSPGDGVSRPLSNFRPMPSHPKDTGFFTLSGRPDDVHINGAIASQYQYQPAMYVGDAMQPLYQDGQQMANGLPASGPQGAQRHLPSGTAAPTSSAAPSTAPIVLSRPTFEAEHWRISPADRTQGLGIDSRGLDVAAQRGSGWQGCRSNKGVKAPGSYYYEAACLEDGLVRVGWSTNDASLDLGVDNYGFGFGADLVGAAGAKGTGRVMHRAMGHDYGVSVHQGDVLGCLLDLDKGSVTWSCNGKVFQRAFTIPDQLRGESFFPAASLKDSRILFNFGDQSLEFHPGGPFVPVAQAPDDSEVPNRNSGWRLNPYDASVGLDVSPDGSMAQAHLGRGWQGCRANQGVRGSGRFYFEVVPLESMGLYRVGWSTEEGSLNLGSDRFGYGYGADNEGFGLNGQQGKRVHRDEIENYGEAFTKDDVIGCFVDTVEHIIKWSKNGMDFGEAYRIPADATPGTTTAFFPAVSLLNSTVEFNFGDKPFQFYPGPDWTPVCCTPADYVKRTRRKGPERKVKGWSYLDPAALEPALHRQTQLDLPACAEGTTRSVERREDDVLRSIPESGTVSHSAAQSSSPNPSVPRRLPPGAMPMPGMVGHSISPISPVSRFSPISVRTRMNGHSGSGAAGAGISPLNRSTNNPLSSTPSTQSPPIPHDQSQPTTSAPVYELRDCTRRVLNGEVVSVQRSAPQVETESYVDEHGKLIKRTVKRSEVTTTKTTSERIITSGLEPPVTINGHWPKEDFDQALDTALMEVTGLDRDISVLSDTVGQVEIRTKPESKL
ncbi:unnamed protein product [Dicrocoelium dendriticum]|nr:unnamed protein product [Dicrocoelium dendriticum]